MERSDHPRSGQPHKTRFGTSTQLETPNDQRRRPTYLPKSLRELQTRKRGIVSAPCRPKHKRESGSGLLDTLSRQPRAVGRFGINPSIHRCLGGHESVFNDSLWAAVGSQYKRGLQVAKSCSLLLLGDFSQTAVALALEGRHHPPRHIVPGVRESVFNDSLWGGCGCTREKWAGCPG